MIVVAARYGDAGVHDLRLFLHEARIEVVATDREQADLALDAWSRCGKGRHPAGLSYGDGFAHALAMASAAPLPFVGEDFARTDVVGARRTDRAHRAASAAYPGARTSCSASGRPSGSSKNAIHSSRPSPWRWTRWGASRKATPAACRRA